MSNEEIKYEKCNRCKCHRLPEDFLNEKGRKLKTCIKCRRTAKRYRNNEEVKKKKAECDKKWRQKSKCEHGKRRNRCVCCGGSQICEHGKRKSICKECKGGSICEHGRQKNVCKECKGASICEHNKIRSICKKCKGGSICEHNKIRTNCKNCGGGSICNHGIQKRFCKICDPLGYLQSTVSNAVRGALKANKSKSSIKYLGTTIKEYKKYLESKFKEGMTWENYGMWEIDHITPIRYKAGGKAPDLEEVIKRLHYTNTQPLWATENRSKGNRFIG
eukprot:jgi/Bigna1/56912/estExt_Genewise1Plus.C_1460009